jgi:hypothetical protein
MRTPIGRKKSAIRSSTIVRWIARLRSAEPPPSGAERAGGAGAAVAGLGDQPLLALVGEPSTEELGAEVHGVGQV